MKNKSIAIVRALAFSLCCCGIASANSQSNLLPSDLHDGVLAFHFERGDYFKVLLALSEEEQARRPLHVAISEQALGLPVSYSLAELEAYVKASDERDLARLRLASYLYDQGDCKGALKHLKGKGRALNASQKTKRAYLRGQCFIALGNKNFAAQSLSQALEGEWAASAYYNLASEHAASSRNPKKALLSLKVARDINQQSSLSETELTNRINLSAGALYLENERPKLASDFFDQIRLDSIYVTQALYLSGVAKNMVQDYRGAIQSWQANPQYGLSAPGVAESLIAIPHAQALSGYQTQALESYIKASKQFQDEQKNIESLMSAIKKYGAIDVLLKEQPRAELEWFLKSASANNTQRSLYMRYLAQDQELYKVLEEYEQLRQLEQGLQNSRLRLESLKKTLSTQTRVISSGQSKQSIAGLSPKAKALSKRLNELEGALEDASLNRTRSLIADLQDRLTEAPSKAQARKRTIAKQQTKIDTALARINKSHGQIKGFYASLDKLLSDMTNTRLQGLSKLLTSHYEQAELGLVQILEAQARLRTKRTNLLDGRYQ